MHSDDDESAHRPDEAWGRVDVGGHTQWLAGGTLDITPNPHSRPRYGGLRAVARTALYHARARTMVAYTANLRSTVAPQSIDAMVIKRAAHEIIAGPASKSCQHRACQTSARGVMMDMHRGQRERHASCHSRE